MSALSEKAQKILDNRWMESEILYHRYVGNHNLWEVIYPTDYYFYAPVNEWMKLTNGEYIKVHANDGWDTYKELSRQMKVAREKVLGKY